MREAIGIAEERARDLGIVPLAITPLETFTAHKRPDRPLNSEACKGGLRLDRNERGTWDVRCTGCAGEFGWINDAFLAAEFTEGMFRPEQRVCGCTAEAGR